MRKFPAGLFREIPLLPCGHENALVCARRYRRLFRPGRRRDPGAQSGAARGRHWHSALGGADHHRAIVPGNAEKTRAGGGGGPDPLAGRVGLAVNRNHPAKGGHQFVRRGAEIWQRPVHLRRHRLEPGIHSRLDDFGRHAGLHHRSQFSQSGTLGIDRHGEAIVEHAAMAFERIKALKASTSPH